MIASGTSNAQSFKWAKALLGGGGEYVSDMVVDDSGNVYLVGYHMYTVDFDPGPGVYDLGVSDSANIFFAKYDSLGGLIWANSIGSVWHPDRAYGIRLDSDGNIYITGYFGGVVDFDPSANETILTPIGKWDTFFAKYDNGGNLIWVRQLGSQQINLATNVDLDIEGNIYLCGSFRYRTDFDPGPDTAYFDNINSTDIYFAKYDNDGNYIWAKIIGGTGVDQPYYMKVDNNGELILTGQINENIDFDPDSSIAMSVGGSSSIAFTAKYNTNGVHLWHNTIVNNWYSYGRCLTFCNDNSIYAAGEFNVSADLDPGVDTMTVSSYGGTDAYFTKYDENGNFVWAKRIGGSSNDYIWSIDNDNDDNIYITGYFYEDADFDPDAINQYILTGGFYDVFFAKYDYNGDLIWAHNLGSQMWVNDKGERIVIDDNNNIYITGTFQNTIDFDVGSDTFNLTAYFEDIYFAKYSQIETNLYDVEVEQYGILLYPNPTSDKLNILLRNELKPTSDLQIELFDLTGKLVCGFNKENAETERNIQISLSGLEKGMYLIRISVMKDNNTLLQETISKKIINVE